MGASRADAQAATERAIATHPAGSFETLFKTAILNSEQSNKGKLQ
jgi:hypothetical protein